MNQSPGPGYVLRWEDFHFNPGFMAAFAAVKASGALAVLVTSQKGVGKKLMSQTELDRIHENMQQQIKTETGSAFDAIFAFTGTPDCRHLPKPDPEMILTAIEELGIDPAKSWMVGDADRDILMGKAAHLGGTIRVLTDKPVGPEAVADETLKSLETLEILLSEKLSAGNPSQNE